MEAFPGMEEDSEVETEKREETGAIEAGTEEVEVALGEIGQERRNHGPKARKVKVSRGERNLRRKEEDLVREREIFKGETSPTLRAPTPELRAKSQPISTTENDDS